MIESSLDNKYIHHEYKNIPLLTGINMAKSGGTSVGSQSCFLLQTALHWRRGMQIALHWRRGMEG